MFGHGAFGRTISRCLLKEKLTFGLPFWFVDVIVHAEYWSFVMIEMMRADEISTPGGPEVLTPCTRPIPTPMMGEVLI